MENQDVDRTLSLLWRRTLGTPQGSRGPKQRVSVDEVVRAAIEVADEEGLPAFSMRKVADRLGLKLMSIYTYVPGRSELIGLMVDEVIGERPLPPHRATCGNGSPRWPGRSGRSTTGIRGCSRWRTAGRGSARTAPTEYEWQLAAIEGAGFTDLEMDQVVTLLAASRPSAARASVDGPRAAEQIRHLGRRVVGDQRAGPGAGDAGRRLPDLRPGGPGRG